MAGGRKDRGRCCSILGSVNAYIQDLNVNYKMGDTVLGTTVKEILFWVVL